MEKLLTEKEEKLLGQFRELLEFGAKIFENHLKIDTNSRDFKKNFISFYFGAIHNYSESIYVLCKDSRPHAATVILRSVLEAFINVIYLMNTNSNLKIAKFAISDFEERIKVLKQFKVFVAKFPKWEGKDNLTTTKDLDNMIAFNQKHKEGIEKGNRFYKSTKILKDLRARAEAYDKKTKKEGNWEFNYLLVYKYFSNFTHLSISGIEGFFNKEDGDEHFDLGQSKGVESHLAMCFGIYLALLSNIKKRGYVPKITSLKLFNQQINKMYKSK